MKTIKYVTDLTVEEYKQQMSAGLAQLDFARSIGFKRAEFPADFPCYHGNTLIDCPSRNHPRDVPSSLLLQPITANI